MTWRADWGGELLGRGDTAEAAQALCDPRIHRHAIVTNEETAERFILFAEGWTALMRGEIAVPKAARLSDPDHWPPLRRRADTDGDTDD